MSLDQAVLDNATAVLEVGDELQPDPPLGESQIPSPRRNPMGMFFSGSPEEDLTPPPSDPLSDDGSGSDVGELNDLDESLQATGPRASSADVPSLVSETQLKHTFRAGVAISTTTAHKLAARTPGQQTVGLYLADPDDCSNIGDPLAEIAHRRGGLAGGQLSPDANNFLQAVMGVVGYLGKQIRGVQDARVIDQQYASGVRQPDAEQAGQ